MSVPFEPVVPSPSVPLSTVRPWFPTASLGKSRFLILNSTRELQRQVGRRRTVQPGG